VVHPYDRINAVRPTRNASKEGTPPFSIYSELGGLPQDPYSGGESSLEAKEVAGGGVQSAGSVYCRRDAPRIQVTSCLPR
jgi:hypothetical protein